MRRNVWAWLILAALLVLAQRVAADGIQFTRDFAALEGYVKPVEQPDRREICLNGSWQFQPVAVPAGYLPDHCMPPELPPPTDVWEKTTIKIPSPWNANTYGDGRNVGAGTARPYWPDSVWFPSYPASWDGVQMGWLRRTFRVPTDWGNKRIILRFTAVAGGCQVFINGQPVGNNFENFLPFEFDITDQVRRGQENELRVGVRHPHLYDQIHPQYQHERRTYADGSNLDGIVGIWQDVFLLGVPAVHIADVFVQPWVDRGELLVETEVQNDTGQAQTFSVDGTVRPWINDAGKDVLNAPEPRWHLGKPVLQFVRQQVQVPPQSSVTVTLKIKVGNELKLWSPDEPNLYGLVMTLDGKTDHGSHTTDITDSRYQRFGWRQFQIKGGDLLLNGKKFQVVGDILHPFGITVQSRRHAWAWFKMIKDVGGNGVRLHAQPWPSYYLDLADEMGVVVLDETGLFGSSLMLNFTEPVTWDRFATHYDRLVLRDRNHPAVFGWSFGNELFAIFDYNHMTPADREKYYAKLTEFGHRSYDLDPTRQWISCDGDEDLRGTLPVWSKHFGHGLPVDRLPTNLAKPLMVGESGGTYYARPSQLAVFNGERAYENYAGRNEALAIDVYQNIVQMARPRLAYFSPSELSWFGIEHLPLGYADFTRLPNQQDGVFFKPFEEGKPGIQPERLPPYTTTFNPGYDPSLPLYKPLAMFDAMKAALAKDGPKPSPWDHKYKDQARPKPANEGNITAVGFLGDPAGQLYSRLATWGVPVVGQSTNEQMLVIDGDTLTLAMADGSRVRVDAVLARGGEVLVCFRDAGASTDAVSRLLPVPVSLTSREATALVRGDAHPWNTPFSLADLYFAEDRQDKYVLKCGLDGDFVKQGRVVLRASDTDWSQFNDVSETAKCAATILSENLKKPSGAALVEMSKGDGHIAVTSIDYQPADPGYVRLWRSMLNTMGVKLGQGLEIAPSSDKVGHDLLLNGPKE